MIKKYSKEDTIKQVFQYGIVLALIFGTADTVPIGANSILLFGTQFLLCAFLIIVSFVKKIEKKTLAIWALMSVIILLSMIFNQDYHGYTVWIIMLIGALVAEILEFDDFLKKLDDIIFIIAVLSLIGAIILILFPSIYNHLPIVSNTGRHKNMFFMVVSTSESTNIIKTFRNYGIFREPAMYCIYLGFALARQWIYVEKPSVLRVAVLLLTIISTRSMTGYVATVFILAVYLVLNRKNKKVLLVTGIVAGSGMLIAYKCDVLWYIAYRFNLNGDSRHSIISRLYSVIVGLMVGRDHFLLGAGATKSQLLFDEYSARLVTDMGVCWANMVTYLFASFGIVFISVFLIGIWSIGFYSNRGVFACCSILIFFSLLMCGEIMTYSPMMYVFMMYGCKKLLEKGTDSLKSNSI